VPGLAAVKVALRQYALTFDGAHEDHPWGENVTRVHDKVFAFFGVDGDKSDGIWCTVKRPKGRIDVKLMKEWIAESYQLVAPKRLAARATTRPVASRSTRGAARRSHR